MKSDLVSFVLIQEVQAPFDASSADNMRRLIEHAGRPGHIYPVALLCHDIMPPPAQVCSSCWLSLSVQHGSNWLSYGTEILQVEKEIGERRVIAYHGTGLSVAPSINFNEISDNFQNPEEVSYLYFNGL